MPQLTMVYCSNNNLNSLDFSNNPLFCELGCSNNPNLSTINIKNNTVQRFWPQTFFNDCWSGLPNLTNICADANEIPALQNYLTSCGINNSGISITSNCNLSNEEYVQDWVNFYPNPSKGLFTINSSNDAKLIIYDILGKVILKQDVRREFENTLDLTNYATGIYYAKIIDFNDNFKMFKLIKN